MNLAQFPRRRYTAGQTPIEKMPRFSAVLGGPDIYIKHDLEGYLKNFLKSDVLTHP